jgi:Fe-S cluster assembly ATPase SufC
MESICSGGTFKEFEQRSLPIIKRSNVVRESVDSGLEIMVVGVISDECWAWELVRELRSEGRRLPSTQS